MKCAFLTGIVCMLCLSIDAFAQTPDTLKTDTVRTDTLRTDTLRADTLRADTVRVQVKYWKTKVKFGANLNQASFSSSWEAGGVNSIGLNSQFNFKARYARKRHSWDNEIDLSYGFVNNAGQGFRKTVDRIFLDTKYGSKIHEKWDMFTSMNFTTQFAPGYKYTKDATTGNENASQVSDIFAPAYATSAWGIEYHPADYFKMRISPFTPRFTLVNNAERFATTVGEEPYGVILPDNTRFEWLAFQLTADFNKDIAENVNLKWRYLLYANYETLELETIDHRLDINLTAKINKFLNAGLGGILLYDFDQVDEVQLSQSFTLGFVYTFQNYKEGKK